MTEYIVKLTYLDGGAAGKASRDAEKIRAALGPLEKMGSARGSGAAKSNWDRVAVAAQKAADKQQAAAMKGAAATTAAWGRQRQREEKDQARSAAQAERISARAAARGERTAARSAAAEAREHYKLANIRNRIEQRGQADEQRSARARSASMAREEAKRNAIAERAAKVRAAAQEKASHKSYYGGETSLGNLFRARASNKTSGLATGAADAILGAPGAIIGGAVGGIMDVASAGASLAFNFGKMAVSAQSMREASVEGFNAIYKSTTMGDKLFDEARTVAKHTKFDTPDVVQRFNNLAGRGFGAGEIKDTYLNIADVETARGYMTANRYENSLSKLKTSPRATFATFQQGAMASSGTDMAEQELAKILGINPKSKNLDATLRDRFREGKVSGADSMQALKTGVNQRYNQGGKSGRFSMLQGDKSWAGMLSNAANGLGDILNSKEVSQSGPLGEFKKGLASIGTLFEDDSEKGKRLKGIVVSMVDSTFLIFDGIAGKSGDTMDSLMNLASTVAEKYRQLMTYIRDEIRPAFEKAINDPSGSLSAAAGTIGIAIGKGILIGMGKAGGELIQHPLSTLGLVGQEGRAVESSGYAVSSDDISALAKKYRIDSSGNAVPRQSMADGGVVGGSGPYGSPQIVQMHKGEVVPGLRGQYMGAAQRAYGGSGGSSYSITVINHITGADPSAAAAATEATLDRYFGRLAAQGG